MKKIFSFFALTAMVLSMGLTGCSNEDPAEPLVVNTNKTATINGIAHATLDATSTNVQYAPSGTKIYLKTKYSNLLSNGSTTNDYVVETTVGVNGEFSANVPVSDNGTAYTVVGDAFLAQKKFSSGNKPYKYTATPVASSSLQAGASGFVTVEYGDGELFE